MKLAAKLILIFLLGVLGIVSLTAWQSVSHHRQWDRQRRQSHASQLIDALSPAIAAAYQDGGTVTIAQAVEISSQTIGGTEIRLLDDNAAMLPKTTTTTRQVSSVSVTNADGTRTAQAYVPLTIDGKEMGTVQITDSIDPHDDYERDSLRQSIISLCGVTLLSALVIYLGGVRLVGKPLDKLIAQVNLIGDGKLNQPPALSSRDELGRLAAAISQMSHRLSQQRDTIRHTDRLGTVGTLAAGIAHELGTPLNVVAGQAGLISSGRLTTEEVTEGACTIKEEADRMTSIIRQLLDFARQKPSPHISLDLAAVARRTTDLINPLARKANVKIALEIDDQVAPVAGDASQLQQVITNLLSNAIAAMPDGGQATVKVVGKPETKEVDLEVHDTGVGIESGNLHRIVEPFFTTKEVGEGTGLGLSIAYGIVNEHNGRLTVDSVPGQGSTFRVTLPAARTEKDGSDD